MWPRTSIVAYGSLLDPPTLADLFADADDRTAPVTVRGFERAFDQEAAWRDVEGDERAVLNVRRSPGDRFNGVLVTGVDGAELRAFRERERGYRLVEVPAELVEPYDDGDEPVDAADLILATTGERTREDIEPAPDYVDLCCAAAGEWGEAFRREFLATTRLPSGESLADRRPDVG